MSEASEIPPREIHVDLVLGNNNLGEVKSCEKDLDLEERILLTTPMIYFKRIMCNL